MFPYKKLTGVFKRQLQSVCSGDEHLRNAAVLTMVCADGKRITVTLPSGVIPDEADIRHWL